MKSRCAVLQYRSVTDTIRKAQAARLQVVVSSHCFSCHQSGEIAQTLAREFPNLYVQIINLDEPQAVKPEAVFAVPTFLLNERIVSLGNPYPHEIRHQIEKVLAAELQ
jgi:mono/diheme cytochrome c family protein